MKPDIRRQIEDYLQASHSEAEEQNNIIKDASLIFSALLGIGIVPMLTMQNSASSPMAGRIKQNVSKKDIYRWLNIQSEKYIDFTRLVITFLEKKGYRTDYPAFYRKAGIDRRLFSKIVSEAYDYHPDIKTVFKLIIGLELGIEDALLMLNTAAYHFGTSRFNLIIRYCVENGVYDHSEIDEYLLEFCGETLYSIK